VIDQNLIFRKLILATLFCTIWASPAPAKLLCDQLVAEIIYHFQRGALGLEPNPYRTLLAAYPELQVHLQEVEDDIFTLLEEPVNTRTRLIETILARWQESFGETVDATVLRDVLIYYAFRLWADDPSLVADPKEVRRRLAVLHREHWLGGVSTPIAQRYAYYLHNVGRLSVPEMAEQLRLSERHVYQDVGFLKISIEKAFEERRLESGETAADFARRRLKSEASIEEIAREISVSSQALSFYLHYSEDRLRGVAWTRMLPYLAKPTNETSILRILFYKGRTSQQIADLLNGLAGIHDTRHPDYRSQNSVTSKIFRLGLGVARVDPQTPDVPLDGYGLVKKDGSLVPKVVEAYLLRHPNQRLADLARRFGVTRNGLKRFLLQENLTPLIQNGAPPNPMFLARRQEALRLAAQYDQIRARRFAEFQTEQGSLQRIRTLAGYSRDIRDALLTMLPEDFPADARQLVLEELQKLIPSPFAGNSALVNKADGTAASVGTRRQLYEGMLLVAQAYNSWAKNPEVDLPSVDSAQLHTLAGFDAARAVMHEKQTPLPKATEVASFVAPTGALHSMTSLPLFATDIHHALLSLLPRDFPPERLSIVETKLRTVIPSALAGSTAFSKRKDGSIASPGTRGQILRGLFLMAAAFNEWVESGGKAEIVDLNTIYTEPSYSTAKKTMRPELAALEAFRLDKFLRPQGSFHSIRELPGRSDHIHDALLEILPPEFPEDRRTVLRKLVETTIPAKTAGSSAFELDSTGNPINPKARRQILEALLFIVGDYNEWVMSDPESPFKLIDLATIHSATGFREARIRMRPEAGLPVTQQDIVTFGGTLGSMESLKDLPRQSTDARYAILSILPTDFPLDRREKVLARLQLIVPSPYAIASAFAKKSDGSPKNPGARHQVYTGILYAVDAYNEWLQQLPDNQIPPIVLNSLCTKADFIKAQRQMRPEILLQEIFEGPKGALQSLRTLTSYSIDIHGALLKIMPVDFPPEELSALEVRLKALISSPRTGNQAFALSPEGTPKNLNARRELFAAIQEIGATYNRWAETKNDDTPLIDLTTVPTKEGFERLRDLMRPGSGKRIEASQAELFWGSEGSLTSIRAIHNYSTEFHTALMGLLPEEFPRNRRAKLLRTIKGIFPNQKIPNAIFNRKPDGSPACPGKMRDILRALLEVVEAYNDWVLSETNLGFERVDSELINTREGFAQATDHMKKKL
jgi:hypothetical protein